MVRYINTRHIATGFSTSQSDMAVNAQLYNDLSSNPTTKSDAITQKWGSHFHLTLRDPTDEFLEKLHSTLQDLIATGYITYYGAGKETKESKIHVHVALGTTYCTRITTITNRLRLFSAGKKQGWSSYYLRPIYQSSSPQQNYEYCTKGTLLYSEGEVDIPKSKKGRTATSDRNAECIRLAKVQDWESIEQLYPGHWIRNGARLKGLYLRQDPPKDQGFDHNKHLWIFGPSGKGKTSIVEYLYPNHYKKRSDPDWLGWDAKYEPHKVILINDLDLCGMSRLGVDHLKELCDPQGFNANKKYAGGDVINPSLVIVTSNFTIGDCLQPDMPGRHEQIIALRRRFRMVLADDFIRENGVVMCTKEEIEYSKKVGLWNDFKYKCLFKPIQYKDDKDYHWLKPPTVSTPDEETKD